MRKQIILFDDQYKICKELKSEKLLNAFLEFMFEDKQPKNNQLNSLETTIFESFINRMEKSKKMYDRNSKGGSSSHGGGRPRNPSQDLEGENSLKTTKQTTKKQPKNKEVEVEVYNIYSYEYICENFYGKGKGVDSKKCTKLIDAIIGKGVELDVIEKCMVLYNCECRLRQEWKFVKKLETWLKEFQPLTEEQMYEQIRVIARGYKEKNNADPKFIESKVAKEIRDDLCDKFGEDKIRPIWKEENRRTIPLIFK